MKIQQIGTEFNHYDDWEFIINKPFDIAKSRRNITEWRIYHYDDGSMFVFVSCITAKGETQKQPIASTKRGNLVIVNEKALE